MDRTHSGRQSLADTRLVPFARPSLPPLEVYADSLQDVWESGMLSNFSSCAQEFEQLIRRYTGADRAWSVASCDLGLTLAVAALGLPRGSRAILPSFTFNSTINALFWNGLKPYFVDVQPGSYGIDPGAVREALDEHTSLIVGTHVFGVPCELDELTEIAAEWGVALLFDAAQAFATWIGDRHVSAFGDASVFSFDGTKAVTSAEGGVAIFADEGVAMRFRDSRTHGFRDDYVSRYVGLNGKLSELHAALGCLTLGDIEAAVERRNELKALYREGLGELDGLQFQECPAGAQATHTYLSIDAGEHRDGLAEFLRESGIESKAYFTPLHTMPLFADQPGGRLEVTERLASSLICLPFYTNMSDQDVAFVCSAVRLFFEGVE